MRRYKIVGIHKEDAYYPDRKQLIGATGTVVHPSESIEGFCSCTFTLDNPMTIPDGNGVNPIFFAVKLEAL